MADSIREQLVAELFVRLSSITIDAGYETNIGLNAFRWKTTEFQQSELPGLDLRDVRSEFRPRVAANFHDWEVEIVIDALLAPTADVAKQLIKAESDIIKAIGPDWRFESVGVSNCTVLPIESRFEVRQTNIIVAAVQSRWLMKYRTQAWDPEN